MRRQEFLRNLAFAQFLPLTAAANEIRGEYVRCAPELAEASNPDV